MTKKKFSVGVVFLILSLFVFHLNPVFAKYPEKTVDFVVSFEPGGGTDLVARTLTRFVNPYLNGKIVVKNVPGAGGAIGFREGAKAAADGYTLTMLVTSIMVGPSIIKGYPTYDLFDPICIVAQDPSTITVKMDSRFRTFEDLISHAKANPGMVSASTFGVGSISHLEMAAFEKATGTTFNLVPYKGAVPALTAAIGGHVDLGPAGCSEAKTYVEGKKLRPLVIFGSKRSQVYPDVPTAKELGYDVVIYQWRGVGVPKGTPKEIKEILSGAFKKAMENEDCKNTFQQIGLERIYLGPEEADRWLKVQSEVFKNLAIKIGLEPK
jgi:tripartite-type tricarboxylate transporter receptor subunit TctC